MIWLVWRRLRIPLVVAVGLAVLVACAAVIGRLVALGVARDLGLLPCLDGRSTGVCTGPVWFGYREGVYAFIALLGLAAIALPGVAGALAGAGLFGAETARGTHVLALSQAMGRVRWFVAGLAIAGLPVAVAVAGVVPLVGWARDPFRELVWDSPLGPATFLTTGVVPVVHTVLAFAVAAAAGLLLRSPIGALGVAVALEVVLLATTSAARPYYLPPETAQVALPPPGLGDPLWGSGVPEDALDVEYGYLDAQGREVPQDVPLDGCDGTETFADCLRSSGLTGLYTRYHPASRYWPFQAIESGLLLAFAAGALGAGLWGLRRRVH